MRKLFIILIGISACCSALCHAEQSSLAEAGDMVLVQGGKYRLGAEDGDPDEMPVHEVYVGSFYIDVHEVTIGQYKKFMEATGHQKPLYWQPELDRSEDPVVGISWQDAAAYALWAGTRLPTEAEWGYAARGGSMHGKYPWGDKPDTSYANFKSFGILPVKSLKPNGYGLYDMIGNVWEWCSDWYESGACDRYKRGDLAAPKSGSSRVLRGGSWSYDNPGHFRCAYRNDHGPSARDGRLGFRVARTL